MWLRVANQDLSRSSLFMPADAYGKVKGGNVRSIISLATHFRLTLSILHTPNGLCCVAGQCSEICRLVHRLEEVVVQQCGTATRLVVKCW